MDQVIIAAVAIGFAAMGGYGLVAPAALMAVFGTVVDTADGRNEVRAVYGGFGLAVAAALVLAVENIGGMRTGIAVAVALMLAGMAVGRIISMIIDRVAAFYPAVFFLLVEAALAGALLSAR